MEIQEQIRDLPECIFNSQMNHKDVSVTEFYGRAPFVMLQIHHHNGEFSLVKRFLLL